MLLSRFIRTRSKCCGFSTSSTATPTRIRLNYEVFTSNSSSEDRLNPVIISHGMLGSLSNWISLSRMLSRSTGRKVVAFDARNHGLSQHVDSMTYPEMAHDAVSLIKHELGIERPVVMLGHSMGGRTAMYTALTSPEVVHSLIVVDVSPVNRRFEVHDSTEWNMSHFFHSLKSVIFPDPSKFQISDARKDINNQLAHRIKDAGIRSWLLMNLYQDPDTNQFRWRNNVDAIQKAFAQHITIFPYDEFIDTGTTFNGRTLFIGGADSEYIPVHDHPDILELFPEATFVYVKGAGHWVHSQKPHEFMELVVSFLRDLE